MPMTCSPMPGEKRPLGLVMSTPEFFSAGYMSWLTPAAVEWIHFSFFAKANWSGRRDAPTKMSVSGSFTVEAVVVGEMDDAHLGPALADGGGHHLVGAPLWEGVPDADDKLGVSRLCADDGQLGLQRLGRFQNGKHRGVPPMFSEERASNLESAGCGRSENKCVESIERKGVE